MFTLGDVARVGAGDSAGAGAGAVLSSFVV